MNNRGPSMSEEQFGAMDTQWTIATHILEIVGITVGVTLVPVEDVYDIDSVREGVKHIAVYSFKVSPAADEAAISEIAQAALQELNPIRRLMLILQAVGVNESVEDLAAELGKEFPLETEANKYTHYITSICSKLSKALIGAGVITEAEHNARIIQKLSIQAKRANQARIQKNGYLNWSDPTVQETVKSTFESPHIYWPLREMAQEVVMTLLKYEFPTATLSYHSLSAICDRKAVSRPEQARRNSDIIPSGRPLYSIVAALYADYLTMRESETGDPQEEVVGGIVNFTVLEIMRDTTLPNNEKIARIIATISPEYPITLFRTPIDKIQKANAQKVLKGVSDFLIWGGFAGIADFFGEA